MFNRYNLTALISCALLYFICLPLTVQMGDTGELVRTAYSLNVPHPPGYPLYNLIYYAFIKFFAFSTVFWRASFLTLLLSITSLFFFSKIFQRKHFLIAALFILLLATTKVFWRYSVLPDVFALNCLFASLILYFYLKKPNYYFLIPFLFSLGLTNHLTLVFLLPIALDAAITEIKNIKMWLCSLAGIGLFAGLYWSLTYMNPLDFDSWGNLTSVKDIFSHFLRKDYGTTQLISSSAGSSVLENFKHIVLEGLRSFVSVILVFLVLIANKIRTKNLLRKEIFLYLSFLLLIFVFFSLANMPISGFLIELFERFLILPFLFFFFIVAYEFNKIYFENKKIDVFLMLFFTINILFNLVNYSKINNFSKNTVINDYAINLLNEASRPIEQTTKPNMLIVNTDARYHAVTYVQDVLGLNKEIIIIHPKLFHFYWYQDKALKQGILANYKKIYDQHLISVLEDIIFYNFDRFNVVTQLPFDTVDRISVKILPVGRLVSPGTDYYLDTTIVNSSLVLNTTHNSIYSDKKSYDLYRELLSEYSFNLFIAGDFFQNKNIIELAVKVLSKSIEIAPWNYKAQKLLCEIKKETDCEAKSEKIKSEYYNYF